jgi:hypothetical protein
VAESWAFLTAAFFYSINLAISSLILVTALGFRI